MTVRFGITVHRAEWAQTEPNRTHPAPESRSARRDGGIDVQLSGVSRQNVILKQGSNHDQCLILRIDFFDPDHLHARHEVHTGIVSGRRTGIPTD